MSIDPSASTLIDSSGEASLAQLASARSGSGVIEMHLAIARRLLRDGSRVQAFQELVRACRVVPMNARLAAALVHHSLAARTYGPALTLLAQGLDEAEGDERLRVMRHLARLARRADELERSREALVQILAERPDDRRARAVLNALLEREERWEELDASLEKETKEALRRGALLRATRSALRRARLWDTRLDEHPRAALRYMQAASYAEQAKDPKRAFWIRLLWLRSLHRSEAPPRALEDAVRVVLAAGEKVGQVSHARSLIEELGLQLPASSGPSVIRAAVQREPRVRAPERRRSTQLELLAVAEEAERAGQRLEAAAVLSAAVQEGDDPLVLRRLESLHIQRANWRELASLYRDLMARAASPSLRAPWAEKLAELLESELADPAGAAKAWGEVAAATGDARARSEQVRLLAMRKDGTGLRAALDAGVFQAASAEDKVEALVQRAEEALTRKDLSAARTDLEAALALDASAVSAAAGLAELAAGTKDGLVALRTFERVLGEVPRRTGGRGDLFRRLARLADGEGAVAASLSRRAWTEVLAELPQDQEGTARLLTLTRASADAGAMEVRLEALILQEPRGPRSRASRLELVALLEAQGRAPEALLALKDAVKTEPGHREAWLGYAQRLEALAGDSVEKLEEVAWALEHAATATAEPRARAELWRRLERLTRERLRQPERAAALAQRVERMLAAAEPSDDAPPDQALPEQEPTSPALRVGATRAAAPSLSARPGDASPGMARSLVARPDDARPGDARAGPARHDDSNIGDARPSDARSVVARPDDARPGEAGPGPARHDDSHLRDARPGGVRPVATTPVGTKPVLARPGDARPLPAGHDDSHLRDARPGDVRPAATTPVGTKPVLARPGEARPVLARPHDSSFGGTRPGDAPPGDARPGNARSVVARPDDARPSDARSLPARHDDSHLGDARSSDARPVLARPVVTPLVAGEARPVPAKPSDSRSVATRPGDANLGDVTPVPAWPSNARPVSTRPDDANLGDATPVPAWPSSARPVSTRPDDANLGDATPVPAWPTSARPVLARHDDAKLGDATPVPARPVATSPGDAAPDAALGTGGPPVVPPGGPPLLGGPLVIPSRRTPMTRPKSPPPPGDEEFEELASALEARLEPESSAGSHKRIPARVARHLERTTIEIPAAQSRPIAPPPVRARPPVPEPEIDDDESDTRELSVDEADLAAVQGEVEEVHSGDLEISEVDAPVAAAPRVVATDNLPALELGDPGVSISPSYGPTPAKMLSAERDALFERVRQSPLDADGYRMLAEHFDTANDATRSSLMLELARALEGDPHAAPRTPRLILNEEDRGGLRHPALRGESGELLSLVGYALTALYPAKGRDGGSDEEFTLGAGRGAKPAADALLAGVRILGLRAPDVHLSEDSGPPFSLVYSGTARILVGRLAVKRELNDAELRFFAGRALFTQLPDLMALRNLRREETLRGLAVIEEVSTGRADSPEARVVRDMVPPRAWERIRPLLKSVLPRLDVGRLAEGARHSANRAGLVVCGGVAPALVALRAKRALPVEITELVRFAASERYLQLRGRVLVSRV